VDELDVDQDMDITFRLQWRRMWKYLTIYMSVGIVAPVALFVLFTWVTKGYDETFRYVSLAMWLLSIPGVVAFSGAFALGIALLCSLMSIRLTDHHLEGRNYWGFKKRIPLNQISSLDRFDSNGYRATVANAGKHGKVYILDQTENIQDILSLLATCIESNRKKAEPPN
jgi:hypothetical protein